MIDNLLVNEQAKQGAAALLTGQEQTSNPAGVTAGFLFREIEGHRTCATSRVTQSECGLAVDMLHNCTG
jgi:hypothetical protein